MRILNVILLSLLLVQVHSYYHGKKMARKFRSILRSHGAELSKYPPFFDHCDELFSLEKLDAHIIKRVLDDVMERLDGVCEKRMLEAVPTIVAGNLYCSGNFPETTDLLLNHILDKVERDCQTIPGFHSIYVFTE